jgi:phage I-like protein
MIAALTLDVKSGTEVQLMPAGEFRARDGRPDGIKGWFIDTALAARVIAQAAARKTPFVIDYEHQTLLTDKNGQPAPAAGWFSKLEWRDGDGLYAIDVEWTAKARAMIDAQEYRFLSPVFSYDPKRGDVLQMLHAALTNVPALDGMAEVAAAAARYFDPVQLEEEPLMNELLKKLLAALGLQETATEEAALSAVTALKTKADQADGLQTQVAALKSAAPDPAKFVSVETMTALQGEVAALRGKLNGQELDGLVGDALEAGKLLPAQEAWARELGGKDIASLKAYLDKAPIVAPGGTQTGGKKPEGAGGNGQLSETDLAVCKQLGISAEEFAKSKGCAA